ncbi:hypothetical protein nvc2_034 [Namao virus]|nr:hypothetical protein nvc2_034 [Namao virus]
MNHLDKPQEENLGLDPATPEDMDGIQRKRRKAKANISSVNAEISDLAKILTATVKRLNKVSSDVDKMAEKEILKKQNRIASENGFSKPSKQPQAIIDFLKNECGVILENDISNRPTVSRYIHHYCHINNLKKLSDKTPFSLSYIILNDKLANLFKVSNMVGQNIKHNHFQSFLKRTYLESVRDGDPVDLPPEKDKDASSKANKKQQAAKKIENVNNINMDEQSYLQKYKESRP